MEAYACCCSFQTMQKCFGLVRCICQYRYVIGVVGVGNCCCGVSSASFLLQFEAILFDFVNRKNQNGFRRNRSTTSQILTIRRILEGVRAKNLQATLIFVVFTKAFDSIHRGKMEQILLAYGIPKETVAAITILYRNTKVKVRSPDGDTEYFDIVAGVLQGDTLAPYLFIICLDYVLRTSIDCITNNMIKHQSFVYTQLNDQTVLFITIHFNITHLHTV